MTFLDYYRQWQTGRGNFNPAQDALFTAYQEIVDEMGLSPQETVDVTAAFETVFDFTE